MFILPRTFNIRITKDAFINEYYPNINYGNVAIPLRIGGKSPDRCRVLLYFDLSSLPQGAIILEATLCLSQIPSNIQRNRYMTVHYLLGNWDEITVTWNNAPNYDPHIEGMGFITTDTSYKIQIPITGMVSSWYNKTKPNYGMLCKDSLEDGEYSMGLVSKETFGGTLAPYIAVTLTVPPSSPINLNPSNGTIFDATYSVQFSATYSDPDNDPMSAYQIEVYNNSTGALVVDTGWVTATQLVHTFSSNTFTNGTQYKWRVRTKDSYGLIGAWSDYAIFTCQSVPSVVITSPTANEIKTTQTITATHSYSSAGGFAQSKYQYVFKQGNTVVKDSGEISGQGNSYTATLPDGNYTLYVTVWDVNSLSNTTSVDFTILTVKPKPANITTTYNKESASVTVTIENDPAWKTSYNTPTFTGTGNGTISNLATTDGLTETGDWQAVCTTLPTIRYLTVGGLMPQKSSYKCFNIILNQTSLGYYAIGTNLFLYNGVTFKINSGSVAFVDGDKFIWKTFAHKIDHNIIKRRIAGTSDWIITNSKLKDISWNDFTVASKQSYDYSVEAVDVFGNVSVAVLAPSIYCEFDNYWVVDQETGVYFKLNPGEVFGKMQSERDRQEYFGQDCIYPKINYSPKRAYRGSFQFVLVPEEGERMPDKLKQLRDFLDSPTKKALIFKSFSGDVYYCDIYNFSFEPVATCDFGRRIAFEMVEVGSIEDVFK